MSNKCQKETQTIIHVLPHILESNKVKAQVMSELKCQTQITLRAEQNNRHIYPMLEYLPFQDIQKESRKIINLPRKLRLQFSSSFKLNVDKCLFDDDGINELCIELKERCKKCKKIPVTFEEKETQTDIEDILD